jgi:hypothetical protein
MHSDTYVLYKCVCNIWVNVLQSYLHNVFSFSTVLSPKKKGRNMMYGQLSMGSMQSMSSVQYDSISRGSGQQLALSSDSQGLAHIRFSNQNVSHTKTRTAMPFLWMSAG